jgi:hypothetical protein
MQQNAKQPELPCPIDGPLWVDGGTFYMTS